MSFNAGKCSVTRITPKSRKAKETNYTLHGQTLAVEESSKYLGVTLTNDLSWNNHVEDFAHFLIGKGQIFGPRFGLGKSLYNRYLVPDTLSFCRE